MKTKKTKDVNKCKSAMEIMKAYHNEGISFKNAKWTKNFTTPTEKLIKERLR